MTDNERKVIKAVADFHKKNITCPFCDRIEFQNNNILKSRKHKKNCPSLIALKLMEEDLIKQPG